VRFPISPICSTRLIASSSPFERIESLGQSAYYKMFYPPACSIACQELEKIHKRLNERGMTPRTADSLEDLRRNFAPSERNAGFPDERRRYSRALSHVWDWQRQLLTIWSVDERCGPRERELTMPQEKQTHATRPAARSPCIDPLSLRRDLSLSFSLSFFLSSDDNNGVHSRCDLQVRLAEYRRFCQPGIAH